MDIPRVQLSVRSSSLESNENENHDQYFGSAQPFVPCSGNRIIYEQCTNLLQPLMHDANHVISEYNYDANHALPVSYCQEAVPAETGFETFYYSDGTVVQPSYGPTMYAAQQSGHEAAEDYSSDVLLAAAWNENGKEEEENWTYHGQFTNAMMQPSFKEEYGDYTTNNNGTVDDPNLFYNEPAYYPNAKDYYYNGGMYSTQDLVDETPHLMYPAEEEDGVTTYAGIPNRYGMQSSTQVDPNLDVCPSRSEEQCNEEEDDDYPTAEDCFQLEEMSREEIKWIIERLVVNLLRNGELKFDAPNSTDRFCMDGVLRVGKRTRTLRHFSPTLCKGFVVLSIVHQLCLQGRTATIREIFYRNKAGRNQASHALRFKDESHCERAILTACFLTGATRASLNLVSNPKGYVCGITMNPQPVTIPTFNTYDDLEWIVDVISRRSDPPEFVLIVEKFSIFHSLVQSDYFKSSPFIVVTGRGFPDLATRKFCRFLRERLNLACLGICDFNPFGLGVMGTYAYGSTRMAGEAFRYVIPDLVVLGLSSQDGEEFQRLTQGRLQDHLQAFTRSDDQFLKGLRMISEVMENEFIEREVKEMTKLRCKLELDVLEDIEPGYLFNVWLPQKVENAAAQFSF